MQLTATLGENFPVLISYELDTSGEVSEITVTSQKTGQELNDLIFGTFVWDEAWNAAERDALFLPATKQWLRAQRLDRLAQTYDTPFAGSNTTSVADLVVMSAGFLPRRPIGEDPEQPLAETPLTPRPPRFPMSGEQAMTEAA